MTRTDLRPALNPAPWDLMLDPASRTVLECRFAGVGGTYDLVVRRHGDDYVVAYGNALQMVVSSRSPDLATALTASAIRREAVMGGNVSRLAYDEADRLAAHRVREGGDGRAILAFDLLDVGVVVSMSDGRFGLSLVSALGCTDVGVTCDLHGLVLLLREGVALDRPRARDWLRSLPGRIAALDGRAGAADGPAAPAVADAGGLTMMRGHVVVTRRYGFDFASGDGAHALRVMARALDDFDQAASVGREEDEGFRLLSEETATDHVPRDQAPDRDWAVTVVDYSDA